MSDVLILLSTILYLYKLNESIFNERMCEKGCQKAGGNNEHKHSDL